jgi:hypothetical protein
VIINWTDPVLTLFKHRQQLRDLLSGGLSFLLGKRTWLAFTGMVGAGKTVLLDHLTGKALKPGYSLPPQSRKMEKGKPEKSERRILVEVVPGQGSPNRSAALDKLFKGKRPVDGVVHVVANGFARIRTGIHQLIKDANIKTVRQYRKHQLVQELEDLEKTCSAILEAHRKWHAPNWLLVAVDQVDLYHDTVEKARDYYTPGADNAFAARLRTLATQVGTEFFHWDAVPACGPLDSFHWNGQTVKSQIDDRKRDAYLAQFLRVIESYCS